MKQLLVGLSIILLVSLILSFTGVGSNSSHPLLNSRDTIDPRKEYPVKMQVVNWDKYYQGIGFAITELRQSDRPSKNTNFLIDSILSPLQQQIAIQLQRQFADTTSKKSK